MADTKISAMASATALTGTEFVPLVQGGVNVQTPSSAFGTLFRTNYSNFGAWQDTTTQTGSTTTPTAMTFNTADALGGVTLVSGSRLTVPVTGVYNLQWSGQFENSAQAVQDIWVWVRINGADLAGSTGLISIPSRKSAGVPSHIVTGWNYFLNLTASQYVELYWLKETSGITLTPYAASVSPPYPATASVIVTIAQVG